MTARLGRPAADWKPLLLAQVRGAIAGGVTVVQIRERGLQSRELALLAEDCRHAAAGSACRVLVNDRVDVALAAGADGVHLRERSISVDEARQLAAPEFLVGRSVHGIGTAVAARTADYLLAGSVYETASKPGRAATLGLDGLRAVVDAAGACPVWAIGGITAEHMAAVVGCGVRGVAAIGAFLPSPGSTNIEGDVFTLAAGLRFSLDCCG